MATVAWSTQDICNSHDSSSLEAHTLLHALFRFIQPIVRSLSPTLGVPPERFADQSERNNGAHAAGNGVVEGQELLVALERYITTAVLQPVYNRQRSSSSHQRHEYTPEENHITPVVPYPSSLMVHSQELPSSVLDALRSHVFNKMPIRVLAFNSNGSGLQLIGRHKIFRHILPGIYARFNQSEFQDRWALVTIKNSQRHRLISPTLRGDSETSLATELIDGHAKYAILSHTWIRDAPGDVVYSNWDTRECNQQGCAKISKFCEVAAQKHGVTLAWMDTVCINKDSSSELDESIRSMFKWYRNATVCITYLSETVTLPEMHLDSWFTRGWTLQELLAPDMIKFYNRNWDDLTPFSGSQSATDYMSIKREIRKATTITDIELDHCRAGYMHRIPISRRMQLAARRQVTREEDVAYSLMGILGVDIPIAYGEGAQRAFFRLMRELLSSQKYILDVFNCGGHPHGSSQTGLIPSSINQFLQRSFTFDFVDQSTWEPYEPIILTHVGVRISLLLVPGLVKDESVQQEYIPIGHYFGTVELLHRYSASRLIYQLLDRRIYTDNLPEAQESPYSHRKVSPIVTFGVLNFRMEDNDIILPQDCLSVPLDCGHKVASVNTSNAVNIIQVQQAVVFQLNSADQDLHLPRSTLGIHGMKLVTLYL